MNDNDKYEDDIDKEEKKTFMQELLSWIGTIILIHIRVLPEVYIK